MFMEMKFALQRLTQPNRNLLRLALRISFESNGMFCIESIVMSLIRRVYYMCTALLQQKILRFPFYESHNIVLNDDVTVCTQEHSSECVCVWPIWNSEVDNMHWVSCSFEYGNFGSMIPKTLEIYMNYEFDLSLGRHDIVSHNILSLSDWYFGNVWITILWFCDRRRV